MLQPQTLSATYWTTEFKVTRADVEHLMSRLLEDETPRTNRELALVLIERRLQAEAERLKQQLARGAVFQPKHHYEVGQEVIFPALAYALGKVVAIRAGNNPDHGAFSVIEVEFDGQRRREFASDLQTDHVLNADQAAATALTVNQPSADEIFTKYGETIVEELEARLVDVDDAIFMGGRWYLESLLTEVEVAHLHLAEAALDMANGGPLPAEPILDMIGLAPEVPLPIRAFSLDVALSQDERFENVGPDGSVQWYLRRLAPDEALNMPPRLEYTPVNYDHSVLSDELAMIERELGDEFSDLPEPERAPSEANVFLIYPHRRVGTLPLTRTIEAMLPPASDVARLLLTFVDGQTDEEFTVWASREGRYITGVGDFFRRHKLPIGAFISLKKTDHPTRFVIDFKAHRPRSEYIRLAVPNAGRLKFESFKRSIGAVYDEQLILGAEDIDGVDQVWELTRTRRRPLPELILDLLRELAPLMPQYTVHAKTLYSAVNIVRRCPPGPIFAILLTRSEFEAVGGAYFRVATAEKA